MREPFSKLLARQVAIVIRIRAIEALIRIRPARPIALFARPTTFALPLTLSSTLSPASRPLLRDRGRPNRDRNDRHARQLHQFPIHASLLVERRP
jgi:hypothetical protein